MEVRLIGGKRYLASGGFPAFLDMSSADLAASGSTHRLVGGLLTITFANARAEYFCDELVSGSGVSLGELSFRLLGAQIGEFPDEAA